MVKGVSLLFFFLFSIPLHAEDKVNVLKEIKQQKSALIAQQSQIMKEVKQLKISLEYLAKVNQEKKESYSKNRKDIAHKLPLMIRLARVNPLQILVNPNVSQNTIRSLVVLRSTMNSLKQQLKQVQVELREIEATSAELEGKESALAQLIQDLEKQKNELADLESKTIKSLANQDLDRVFENENINSLLEETETLLSSGKSIAKKASQEQGLPFRWLETPVKGKVVDDKAMQKKFNPNGKGLVFETKKNAEVHAPASGLVVFNGPFQSQGDIIILDHGQKVFTVLMGMHKINAEVGQSVYTGEKIGTMAGYGKTPPHLYLELRKAGGSINPKPYIAE